MGCWILFARRMAFASLHWAAFAFSIFLQDARGQSSSPRRSHPTSEPSNVERFLDGFFRIGVFSQPVDSFEKWRERGINTLLETPQNHDPSAWDRAAQRLGFRLIRRPMPNPRDDIHRNDLLAWSHWDEPDAAGRIFEWTPLFEKIYTEWKSMDPNRKIFINFAGPDITWFTSRNDEYSRRYASHYPRLIATADWIASDIYPCGGWLNQAHERRRGDVSLIAEPIQVIRKFTDKPQFAFIETSEIERGNVSGARCPTADEVRAEIWLAIAHGVRGIFYFPAVVGTNGFQFDGTPPAVVAEMKLQNEVLTKLAPILQGTINPPLVRVTVPSSLHVGWRSEDRKLYVFVINPSRESMKRQTIKVRTHAPARSCREFESVKELSIQNGQWQDDFGPLAVKIYVLET